MMEASEKIKSVGKSPQNDTGEASSLKSLILFKVSAVEVEIIDRLRKIEIEESNAEQLSMSVVRFMVDCANFIRELEKIK